MARWAEEGTVYARDAARLLTFDVIVNTMLDLNMTDDELVKYSQVESILRNCRLSICYTCLSDQVTVIGLRRTV